MYDTSYHKASSASEAAKILNDADEGKLLAGGQTLLPTMKQRLAAPSDLVDISGIDDMRGVSIAGNRVTIGAMTTHAEVASDAALASACPAISGLAANIGDPAVRHRGTIGGSVANNDPAADYPAALLALGATVVTTKREYAAADFFTGLFSTALDEDEIITSVQFDCPETAGYSKFPNPASRYAMVGVFAANTKDGARVAVTGAGDDGVFRHTAFETALSSHWSAEALDGIETSSDSLLSDIHGSATYRAHLIGVMTKRAIS